MHLNENIPQIIFRNFAKYRPPHLSMKWVIETQGTGKTAMMGKNVLPCFMDSLRNEQSAANLFAVTWFLSHHSSTISQMIKILQLWQKKVLQPMMSCLTKNRSRTLLTHILYTSISTCECSSSNYEMTTTRRALQSSLLFSPQKVVIDCAMRALDVTFLKN